MMYLKEIIKEYQFKYIILNLLIQIENSLLLLAKVYQHLVV